MFTNYNGVSTPVTIKGRIRNKTLIMDYVDILLKELKIHRFKTREIIIHFKDVCADGVHGLCSGDTELVEIEVSRWNFDEMRSSSFIEMMKTLTHELVHGKQFLRGELNNECGWTWKGRKADGWKYENQPWEKEAYRLEEELFVKCFPINEPFKN